VVARMASYTHKSKAQSALPPSLAYPLGTTIETGKRVSDLVQDPATGKITGVK